MRRSESKPVNRALSDAGRMAPSGPVKWIALALLAAAIAYYGLLFAMYGGNADFLLIDRCLDAGGRWNFEQRHCEGAPATR